MKNISSIIKILEEEFGGNVLRSGAMGEHDILIDPSNIRGVASFLKNDAGLRLITITCVDLLEKLQLIYHFDFNGTVLNVKINVSGDKPEVDSIHDIVPSAALYEREVWEMFGVVFRGHPKLTYLFLPENWPKGTYPLRKNYGGVK